MLARAFRRILLIELLIYLAASGGLVRLADWKWTNAGLAVFAFALALRALAIATTFVEASVGESDEVPANERDRTRRAPKRPPRELVHAEAFAGLHLEFLNEPFVLGVQRFVLLQKRGVPFRRGRQSSRRAVVACAHCG